MAPRLSAAWGRPGHSPPDLCGIASRVEMAMPATCLPHACHTPATRLQHTCGKDGAVKGEGARNHERPGWAAQEQGPCRLESREGMRGREVTGSPLTPSSAWKHRPRLLSVTKALRLNMQLQFTQIQPWPEPPGADWQGQENTESQVQTPSCEPQLPAPVTAEPGHCQCCWRSVPHPQNTGVEVSAPACRSSPQADCLPYPGFSAACRGHAGWD